MIIKCPHCGEICESDSDIPVGQHVECPFCAKRFYYGKGTNNLGDLSKEDVSFMAATKATSAHPVLSQITVTGKHERFFDGSKKRIRAIIGISLAALFIGVGVGVGVIVNSFSGWFQSHDIIRHGRM